MKRVVHLAVIGAVGGGERISDFEAEAVGDTRADHAGEEVVVAEILPRCEPKRLAVAAREPAEEVGIRADDPEAAVVVPHAGRHGNAGARGILPVDSISAARCGEELLIEVPADVLDRLADQVDGVEDELEGAPLRPHDHVVAKPRPRLEGLLDDSPGDERCHDQCHTERQRHRRQGAGEGALADVAPGDAEEVHGE